MYIYNDEDNQPMYEDNVQNDRDCMNCIHKHPNGDCTQWDCKFEPREGR